MTFLEKVRNKFFWLLDKLRGEPIGKHYKEIKTILDDYHAPESKALRENALSKVLAHAAATTPFYRHCEGITELSKFPITDKIMVKERFEEFRSETYKDKNNYKVSTSGSTGIPFTLYQNMEKRNRNVADSIVFAEKVGVIIGIKVIIMSIWNVAKKKSPLLAFMQNVEMQEVTDLSDPEIEKFLLKLKKNKSKKGIWAYASALDNLSHFIENNDLEVKDANVKGIVACSEKLDYNTKLNLEKRLDTAVVSRYSNAENGLFAQQYSQGGTTFFINHASYYFEVLKFESNEPQEYGVPGRIVLTDLYNYCMPLIRYDTGDVGTMLLDENNVPVFTKIEGRKQDLIYTTNGDHVSSFALTYVMMGMNHIKQYQFIQEGEKDYVLKVNAPYYEEDKMHFIREFKNLLGDNANITIDYIDEIPLLFSGKRKRVVNAYAEQMN